ncbi:hypothetical protein [Tomitella gaofuii]|uniref:hypothetical protein n=1 Tax=Tomitella gaofuii TaxID=2760083 RepID=UPI0015FA8CEB|nr:hypothetical protein [Tomitella gaofuii]
MIAIADRLGRGCRWARRVAVGHYSLVVVATVLALVLIVATELETFDAVSMGSSLL